MSEPTSLASEHTISVDAPANVVFDILADTTIWPSIFRAVIYVERSEVSAAADQLRTWALRDGEQVSTFTSHRELDRGAGQITFRDEPAEEPLATSSGRWSIVDGPDGSSTVRLEHVFTPAAGADPERVRADQAATWSAVLTELAEAAARYKELPELIVAFEDPLYIAGEVEQVYQLLYRADEWPSRFPHVKRIDMTETAPNIQFFDMDTVTPDGRAHTTRSVRICFPNHKIVYKQIGLPPLLTAHLGHWLFEENPEGLIASARHEATIKPSALSLLAPEATVQDARRYLRKVLSANSMSNLRIAKELVERPAGA